MNNEPHKWEIKDTIDSVREVTIIGALALAECMKDSANWIVTKVDKYDTKWANRMNGPEDEI